VKERAQFQGTISAEWEGIVVRGRACILSTEECPLGNAEIDMEIDMEIDIQHTREAEGDNREGESGTASGGRGICFNRHGRCSVELS